MNIHQKPCNMKKNPLLHLSVWAVLIAFVCACSQDTAEYTNVIPANATDLVSVNLKTIAEKAGIHDKENKEALAKLTDAMKSGMSAATYQQLEAVMKDPSKSGIDVSAPIYLFSAPAFNYQTVVAKVNSEADLRNFLEAVQKEISDAPLAEGDGYSFLSLNKQTLLAFNSSTLLLVDYKRAAQLEKAKEGIAALLEQTAENSINQSGAFQKLKKQSGDINMLISPSSAVGTYANQFNFALSEGNGPKDLMGIGSLSFEKGKIEMQIENYTENPETKALLDKLSKSTCPVENSFLKYFPKSTIALFSMGVKGEELYNMLQESEQFRNEFSITKAAEVKALFSNFQKDITVGLINVTMTNTPSVLAYANVKNNAPLKALYEKKGELGLKRGEDIVKLNEDEYVYKSRRQNLFFGVRDKQMYATNDELLYKNVCKSVDPSAKETDYVSALKGKRAVAVINAEEIMELPLTKMMLEYTRNEYSLYIALAQSVSYLEMSNDGDKTTSVLNLKDKNVNALKQLTNLARESIIPRHQ